jgi:ribosomal protein L11 methyltransferase
MQNYYEIIIGYGQDIEDRASLIDAVGVLATQEYNCSGIEHFCLEENEVDEILGDKSYCGGDVTSDIISDVEKSVNKEKVKYFYENENSAISFKKYIDFNIKFLTATLNIHEVKDWNAEWKKHFKKIQVSEELTVVPSWNKVENKINDLYIYPGMGFGTGSHETTFLCLKYYEEMSKKTPITSCFDHGCGSGILGIAPLKKTDTCKVHFYDIDVNAMENSKKNIEINELENKNYTLFMPDEKDQITEEYDLVFANILKHILLEERSFIINRTKIGGQIVLSGLLAEQIQEFKKEFQGPELEFIKEDFKADWALLAYRRV